MSIDIFSLLFLSLLMLFSTECLRRFGSQFSLRREETRSAVCSRPARSTSGMAAALLRTRHSSGLGWPSPHSRLRFLPLCSLVSGDGAGAGSAAVGAKFPPSNRPLISIEPGVRRAVEEGRPVVALESTIISHGMPYPENLAMARGVEDIIRRRGAVPATVAILAGRPHVGLTSEQLEALAKGGPRARKCSRRDLAVAIAQGVDGATTVASTSYLASLAGVKVFVTGGMGGVHRGAESTFDVSADLSELAQTPIVVVCAGVKSILDVEKTLEVLETNGVPVISYGTDEFPAFFSPSSGVQSPLRLDKPCDVAAAAKAGFDLGLRNGMVVAVPNPSPMAGGAGVDAAIHLALEEANAKGLKGRDVTPFVLASVNETTGGQSLKSNVALVRHNAEVGADIAIELAALEGYRLPRGPTQSGPSADASVPPSPVSTRSRLAPVARHRPTRVAVFGGAVADIVSKPYPGTALSPGTSNPGETRQSFGGVGRNVAEGVARVLLGRQILMGTPGCGGAGSSGSSGSSNGGDGGGGNSGVVDVTLVAAVGEDDVGRALVAGCEDVGVNAEATVEVVSGAGRGNRDGGSEINPGTASYVAILGDDGDLVTAVADMRVMERMTADFVGRHSGVIDGAVVVVVDGNLPPEGFAHVARLCALRNVPLVFEPTSVTKSGVPFLAEAAGGISLATPNLDELAAMSSAAGEKKLVSGRKIGSTSPRVSPLSSINGGALLREGHSLAQAAIADGELVDARPLGPSLTAVLAAMLEADARPASNDSSCATHAPPMPLIDGARHVAVTMGSAGVILASARPAAPRCAGNGRGDGNGDGNGNSRTADPSGDALVECPPGSGRWFSLSAEHYPALPLDPWGKGAVVDCTGAGDCLVAGMVGGLALGWSTRDSLCLGLVCARESAMAEKAVPESLGGIFGHPGKVLSGGVGRLLSLLPSGYGPKAVNPWGVGGGEQ